MFYCIYLTSWKKEIKCEFNKFNSTGARMLDSFYHMIVKQLLNHVLRDKR